MRDARRGSERGPDAGPVRLTLTRVCVRTGRVRLPARARAALPAGTLEVHDDATGETWTLRIEGGVVDGLGPFLTRHGAIVNDEVIVHAPTAGPATLALRRSGAGGAHGERALRRAVQALVEGAPPQSVEELRDAYGLPADAPLEAALAAAPDLERRAGRWGRVGAPRVTDPLGRPAADPPAPDRPPARDPAPTDPAQLRAHRALEAFGLDAAPAGRTGVAALLPLEGGPTRLHVRLVPAGAAPAWQEVLDEARAEGAGRLALAGAWEDLAPYARYVRSAGVSLVPWDALERLAEDARAGDVSVADLAALVEAGGLHGAAFERFEARLATRRADRERFWEVVARVASRPVGSLVEPAALADARVPVAAVREALAHLAGAPWFAVERVEDGRVRVRADVRDAFTAVHDAATARLGGGRPAAARRVELRGDGAPSGGAEILEGGDA